MRLRGFYYNGRTVVVVVVVVQLYINALSILTVEDDSCVSVLTLFERIPVFFSSHAVAISSFTIFCGSLPIFPTSSTYSSLDHDDVIDSIPIKRLGFSQRRPHDFFFTVNKVPLIIFFLSSHIDLPSSFSNGDIFSSCFKNPGAKEMSAQDQSRETER